MAREIVLNAFSMNTIGHSFPGFWRHPRDRSAEFNDLDLWLDFARILERGLFDAVFFADVIGVYDVYGGNHQAAVRTGTQSPSNDPFALVPAMAAATRHLGFGVTANVVLEPPFMLARRFSTLDHITRGRIGWNIVTGFLDSGARGKGLSANIAHDERYAIAEDYCAAVYSLWEASWEDGAVVRDRARNVVSDPARVHRIRHDGPYFQVDAVHMVEPSPQRTPYLYQAGASSAGRDFAARHAECVFLTGCHKRDVRRTVDDIRARAEAAGRHRADVSILFGLSVIVARTEAEARDRYEEYARYVDVEGSLALISGWTGLDLSRHPVDAPIAYVETNATRSVIEALTRESPDRAWTVGDLGGFRASPTRGPIIVGTPDQVADELIAWVEEADVDGFNLMRTVMPEYASDFVDLVVPELQARGRYKTAYRPGTLREKLSRHGGPRLPATHPAAASRRPSRP